MWVGADISMNVPRMLLTGSICELLSNVSRCPYLPTVTYGLGKILNASARPVAVGVYYSHGVPFVTAHFSI